MVLKFPPKLNVGGVLHFRGGGLRVKRGFSVEVIFALARDTIRIHERIRAQRSPSDVVFFSSLNIPQ